MASLSQFAKRMRVISKNVNANADKITRTVALAIDAAVVIATPVDTGRARSNWQVELNNTPGGTREPYAPGQGRSTEGENTREAIEHGKKVIGSYKKGNTIHITNNLSYIGRLNEGWSAQAPAAYVEKAALVGANAVAKSANITSTIK